MLHKSQPKSFYIRTLEADLLFILFFLKNICHLSPFMISLLFISKLAGER